MTSDDKIGDKKKYNTISREKQKKFGKIDKYEYHTGKEILTFDQSRMIEQAKFTDSFLEKLLENK